MAITGRTFWHSVDRTMVRMPLGAAAAIAECRQRQADIRSRLASKERNSPPLTSTEHASGAMLRDPHLKTMDAVANRSSRSVLLRVRHPQLDIPHHCSIDA